MAYELPLVRVYQQLEEVSPALASPDLPAIVIGRAYQILTYADDKSQTLVEAYDRVDGNVFTPPNILAGGLLEASFTKIYLDDAYIQITDGTFDATLNDNELEDTGKVFTDLDIDVGDKVYIDHASLTETLERTIIEIQATKLILNKNFIAAMVGATYSVQKKLDDRLLPSTDYVIDGNEVTINPGLNHTYNAVSYPVMSGMIYMEYKALRTDLTSAVDDVSSTNEILAKVGKIDPENPLALGLKMAKDNTTTSVKFLAVNTKVGDELGWSNVKDILENDTNVYFLSLLTDDSTIIGIFKNHCEQMSTADNHGWRVCSGGTPLVTEKTVVDESLTGEIYDSGGILYFRDNEQEFLQDNVSPSDSIEITAPSAVTGSYTVNQVINDNVLEVTSGTPFPTTATPVTYTIQRSLSKTQQAEEIAAGIDAYNSKRVVIVWPDEFEYEGEVVDGFYAGCVIAGMVAGLPPHQGFTNLGVASMGRLYHSNTYFNKDQLNTIAEAGGWIFVQDSPNALPYVRHQVTTDMSLVETRELNVVKNFDHLSYYFFETLSPFIGQYNITDRTLQLVTDTINLAAQAKMKQELPKIGAPLQSYTIVSSERSSVSSDKIESKVRLDLPKPLNGIDLYLAI